jgi:PIN domain nuclease of toxin-antitoxin system
MRFLLDTHALIWLISDADRLSQNAADAIRDGEVVFASHVSLWEMAIKIRTGKLKLEGPSISGAGAWFARNVPKARLLELPIIASHLAAVEFLPDLHRDPFDRLLVTQASIERLVLISSDQLVQQYDIDTLW